MYDFIALLRTDRWESLGYMEQHFQFIESLLHDKMQSHRKAHFFPCGLGGVCLSDVTPCPVIISDLDTPSQGSDTDINI